MLELPDEGPLSLYLIAQFPLSAAFIFLHGSWWFIFQQQKQGSSGIPTDETGSSGNLPKPVVIRFQKTAKIMVVYTSL